MISAPLRYLPAALLIGPGLFSSNAVAYKEGTHKKIAENATQQSVLSNVSKLNDMGLRYPFDSTSQQFPNSVVGNELINGGNGSVLIRAYDALSSYCDEGTKTDSRGATSFRRCFSRDGRFNDWYESSTDAELLARWGDGRIKNVWEGRTIAGVRVTSRYQQRTDGGMPFNYATGSDFPSRILDLFLMATHDRAAVIDGLSRFHAVEVPHEPGVDVFERLGEIRGRNFVSRELLFVRQSDHLIIEYQRFGNGELHETVKLTNARANPSLSAADLAYDMPAVRLNAGQFVGLLWFTLYFGAPLYSAYWLIRRKRYRDRRSRRIAIACIAIWGATLGFAVAYFFSGAWYSEDTSLARNAIEGPVGLSLYLCLPIAIIFFLWRRSPPA